MNFPKPFPAPSTARVCLDVEWEAKKERLQTSAPKHSTPGLAGGNHTELGCFFSPLYSQYFLSAQLRGLNSFCF